MSCCTEEIAKSEITTADVYFVPAFSGLYAPYWETDARGLIIGLTNFTNKAHLCRATLEAVCFQSKEASSDIIQGLTIILTLLVVLVVDYSVHEYGLFKREDGESVRGWRHDKEYFPSPVASQHPGNSCW